MIYETQMPIASKHAFKEKSAKLLILLPLRTIYFQTFQCETPCISQTPNVVNKNPTSDYVPVDIGMRKELKLVI